MSATEPTPIRTPHVPRPLSSTHFTLNALHARGAVLTIDRSQFDGLRDIVSQALEAAQVDSDRYREHLAKFREEFGSTPIATAELMRHRKERVDYLCSVLADCDAVLEGWPREPANQ